jgi:DNA modification methylase
MSNNFISSVWEFENLDKNEPSQKVHNFLRWYGKLPPQLVERLLNLYSEKKDLILANFSGSGTIALESLLNNRDCIGIDSNPLAVILSNVKTHPLNFNFKKFNQKLDEYVKTKPKKIKANDEYEKKWFKESSFSDINLIKSFINKYSCTKIEKEFLLLTLASTIKKLSLVDSRCINHIVLDKNKENPDTIKTFKDKLEKMSLALGDLKKEIKIIPDVKINQGDARKLQLPNDSIKLVISHPPYLGNVDYTNINQLENYILGYDYESIRNTDLSTNSLEKYLANMYTVIDEMYRVVKKDGRICLIIGDNRKNGEIVPTFSYFIQYAKNNLNLKLEDTFIWVLNQKAGMNIKRHGNHIDHNYILVFRK